jgi:hypothetical protein
VRRSFVLGLQSFRMGEDLQGFRMISRFFCNASFNWGTLVTWMSSEFIALYLLILPLIGEGVTPLGRGASSHISRHSCCSKSVLAQMKLSLRHFLLHIPHTLSTMGQSCCGKQSVNPKKARYNKKLVKTSDSASLKLLYSLQGRTDGAGKANSESATVYR